MKQWSLQRLTLLKYDQILCDNDSNYYVPLKYSYACSVVAPPHGSTTPDTLSPSSRTDTGQERVEEEHDPCVDVSSPESKYNEHLSHEKEPNDGTEDLSPTSGSRSFSL